MSGVAVGEVIANAVSTKSRSRLGVVQVLVGVRSMSDDRAERVVLITLRASAVSRSFLTTAQTRSMLVATANSKGFANLL